MKTDIEKKTSIVRYYKGISIGIPILNLLIRSAAHISGHTRCAYANLGFI